MNEKQVGFLYKAATTLATLSQNKPHIQHLRSYYLMRCYEKTKGYGLPQQHFSVKKRCPHCCLEWTKNTDTKIKSLHLSKRQKRRIKRNKLKNFLLHSNVFEQICSFCKHTNSRTVLKPMLENKTLKKVQTKRKQKRTIIETNENQIKKEEKNKILNAYITSKDVFSLRNEENTLRNTIKEKPKIIQNNKKKKDKFAGLCKQAVLASAKLKVEKAKQDNLSLFLKPCP